jgi:hypothetical protein
MLLFILLIQLTAQAPDFPLRNGKPTPRGVDQYVEIMGDSIIGEYQAFVKDTLYYVDLYTEDPGDDQEIVPMELGYYFPYEIAIIRGALFEAYELDDLSVRRRRSFRECNRFVKAAIIHELTHSYMNQITVEMRSRDRLSVHPAYQTDIWILRSTETYGSVFIQEGICEYVTGAMGELIPPAKPYTPLTDEDLLKKENEYSIFYKYSAHVLKPFLDTMDLKQGIMILMYNAPPNQTEILNPDLYFKRLQTPFQKPPSEEGYGPGLNDLDSDGTVVRSQYIRQD